jgi:hypothetical protein
LVGEEALRIVTLPLLSSFTLSELKIRRLRAVIAKP